MKKIKQFFMPLLLMLFISLGISPQLEGQTGSAVITSTPGGGLWPIPPGVSVVTAKVWGAGGGGGNFAGTDGQGGGGGGAFHKVSVGLFQNLYSNVGGVSVGSGGTAGNAGGQSTFAAGLIAAAGGSGSNSGNGFGGPGGVQAPFPTGPVGNVVINSSTTSSGGNGGASTNPFQTSFGGGGGGRADDGVTGGNGGPGGTSGSGTPGTAGLAGGGVGGNTGGVGANATSYGGGGGGRGFGGANSGTGGNGRIEITWNCPTITSLTYPSPSVCSYSSALTPTVLPATAAFGGTYTSVTLGSFLNAGSGAVAPGAPQGTHVITYGWTANNGCPAASASFTLTIAPQAVVSAFSYATPYCSNSGTVTPTFTATGVAGTFTSTAGLSLNASNGAINTGTSTPGSYTVTYTVAASGNCNVVTATANVTITALPIISAFDYPGDNTYCTSEGVQTPVTTYTGPNAGTYSSTAGLSLNATTGAVDPATSTVGVYTVTYTIAASAGCAAVADVETVEILALPLATIAYSGSPYCATTGNVFVLPTVTPGSPAPVSGTYSYTGTGTLQFNTATGSINLDNDDSDPGTYTVTYTFAGANGCTNTTTTTVVIKARPTSTISYSGPALICSNVSPIVSGTVTAVGAWTLTLSNGQTATGTGNGPWSIAINTMDPGEILTVFSVSALVDANNCPAAGEDRPGSVVISKRTITSGSIPNASNVKVCLGQDASVNVTLTSPANNCAPNPQFTGVFKLEKWNGSAWVFFSNYTWTLSPGPSTTSIPAAVTIPASAIPNTTNSITEQYRVSWVSLTDCNGCTASLLTGSVVVEVVPVPLLTVSAAPAGNICPGTTINFAVNQAANSFVLGAVFNWTATDAAGNILGQAYNQSFGPNAISTNLGITCPFNSDVTFTIKPLNPNCCNCLGPDIIRVVKVRDILAPTWNTPVGSLNRTAECNSAAIAAAQALFPVATDNCDNDVTNIVKVAGAFVPNAAPCTQSGTFTNTWTVTDECGNTSVMFTQVITITDLTAPVLTGTIPAGITLINNCKANAPTPPTAAAIAALFTDNCGTVSATLVTTNTGDDCAWSFTHTYTVKDNCGNTVANSPVIVYSGGDKNAPVLKPNTTFPIGETELNLCASQAPAGPTAAAIAALYVDICGGIINVVKTEVRTGTDCNWEVIYTYSIKDKCGNEVLPQPTIRYQGFDATAPVLSGNNTFPVGSANNNVCFNNVPAGPTADEIKALYVDNCGGLITVVKTNVKTGDDCAWTIVYTYSIKDKCNNEVLPKPTVTFTGGDKTAPNLITGTFPVGTLGNNSCYSAAPAGPTADDIKALYVDNCGGLITVVKSRVNNTSSDCGWNITYTYSIKDKCNNEVLPRPTITYGGADATAPSIGTNTFPVGQTGINSCYSAADPASLPTNAAIQALYTDNCLGVVNVARARVNTNTNNCNWSYTYTYTITDICGNTVLPKPSITYSGADATAPVFAGIVPTQILNVGAFANCMTTIPDYRGLVSVTDCGTFTLAQLIPNAIGTSVSGWGGYRDVVIEATDACGNKSTTTFRVELKDLTAPTAICKPFTLVLNANGTGTIVVANVNNGSFDNCASAAQLTYSLSSTAFTCANLGANTVTLSVTDQCLNTSTCTAIVTVVDNTAPVITCFGDTTVNKDANCTYTMPNMTNRVTTADACGVTSVTQNIPVGHVFAASQTSTVVTLTVKDASGNTSTCTFTVNFVDVTPPVIVGCPANITVFTGLGNALCSQTATWTPPTATDACTPCCQPGTPQQTITGNFAPGATFPRGVTTVTYTATDLSGNTSTCSFTVTVVDNTKPLIANCPANISVNTGVGRTTCDQTATWTEPTATDNCTAAASLVRFRSHAPGATFPVGTTKVKYAFTDSFGNTSDTCRFDVVVIDNTVPVFLTCPANIANPPINTAGCLANLTTVNPTFSDNCQVASLTWTLSGATTAASPTSGINYVGNKTFGFGVTTVTYTLKDVAGNTAIPCAFTVTVTRPLSAAITASATVLQNLATTSTVGFSAQGGTAPYTFVYTTTNGFGAPGATITTVTGAGGNASTVASNPNHLITTVPQSNAQPGTYTYTLVSVTDFYGCVVTPNVSSTITILAFNHPAPDLASSIYSPFSSAFTNGELKDGIIEIENVVANPTTGEVQVRITRPSNYTMVLNSTMLTSDGIAVDNSNFNITLVGSTYVVKSNSGYVIPANSVVKIGYSLRATSGTNTSGILGVTLVNGTGGVVSSVGDSNNSNNKTIQIFTNN